MIPIDPKVIEKLSNFGLDETEATVYTGLLHVGSVTIGTLSTKLGIDRGKTYRIVSNLKNKGIVKTTFTNPTLCDAIPVRDAFATLIEKKENEIVMMKKISKEIIEELEKISNLTVVDNSTLDVVQGRANIYNRISALLKDAKETVYLIAPIDDILRMYHTSIPEKITEFQKRGGEIRLLTQTKSEDLYPHIKRLNISQTRIGKLPSKSRLILEKGTKVIMSGSIQETMDLNDETDSVIQTNSEEMVNMLFTLCQHVWSKAKPFDEVVLEV
ncbi:MAG: HTH-type sugar sensing transcriptional regulator TrmB [Nitrosopumilus sp.]|nr:HTH-type sugar sensing transcriptional regulator TrmB [Nitrosopumilus sp.]